MAVDQQGLLSRLVPELVRLPVTAKRPPSAWPFIILKADQMMRCDWRTPFKRSRRPLVLASMPKTTEGELCEYVWIWRDQTRILVVEEPSTLYAVEGAGHYRGLYHVLLGALSPLDGVGPSDIRAEELIDRSNSEEFRK